MAAPTERLDRLVRALKTKWSPSKPIRVLWRDRYDAYGSACEGTHWWIVIVRKDDSETVMSDTLLHEVAHVLVGDSDCKGFERDHGPEFWLTLGTLDNWFRNEWDG